MAEITRSLTPGEIELLKSVFASTITYSEVKVCNYKAYFFQPDDTAMTPDGKIYFPEKHYLDDFSTAPLHIRAWFVHEGAHLYQYYSLRWNIKLRGMTDRNYDYKLDPRKNFSNMDLNNRDRLLRISTLCVMVAPFHAPTI